MRPITLVLFIASFVAGPAAAADLADIRNYREYSPTFSSAGQPTETELNDLKSAGFQRVIYLAFSNGRGAIASEDALVKELGMNYVHIPVVWTAPTVADFETFAATMQSDPQSKTFLHCAANFRASAFAFLYRVIYEDVPVAEAKADMNSVWQPNETWRKLIFDVLEDHDISPNCDGCDWTSED